MKIIVKYFGVLADITGKTDEFIPDIQNMRMLQHFLLQKYSGLENQQFQYSVNHKLVREKNCTFADGDEIALLPPFAGG